MKNAAADRCSPLLRSSMRKDIAIYTNVPHNGRRIISARRAERHEREAYWKNVR
jgi:uncharacterized DUF497 family protein